MYAYYLAGGVIGLCVGALLDVKDRRRAQSLPNGQSSPE
jgi:hypothetical protein